jgi:hypothetical protein
MRRMNARVIPDPFGAIARARQYGGEMGGRLTSDPIRAR